MTVARLKEWCEERNAAFDRFTLGDGACRGHVVFTVLMPDGQEWRTHYEPTNEPTEAASRADAKAQALLLALMHKYRTDAR